MAQPKLVNTAVRALLHIPLLHRVGSSYVMILAVSERKTGRVYHIPVGYARDGSTVLTTTDDRWWRNMSPSAPVRLLLERRRHTGVRVAVTDRSAAAAGMAVIAVPNREFPPTAEALALAGDVVDSLGELTPGRVERGRP